jgi:23S rRNA (cytosine1962-C5)-methyltransferase
MSKRIILKKPPQGSLRPGHPWIYKNQVKETEGIPEPGDIIDVVTESGRFLARGYWNPKSEIAIRVLSRQPIDIGIDFFRAQIAAAREFRKLVVKDTNAFRLISSEADGLPGLIVDQYGDVLVLQILTLGMEKMRETIIQALSDEIPYRGLYEKSDVSFRLKEGLEIKVGWIDQRCGDEVVVYEKDIEFGMRFGEGHKTGLYLDQRDNRFILRDQVKAGDKVLDVFCNEGAFGLHMARVGCDVTGIEIQEDAVKKAQEHRSRNKIDPERYRILQENAFDALKRLERSSDRYDLIILDPPSFVKQKSALGGAMTGYKETLLRSFKICKEGGLVAVFSCAYYMDENLLMQVSLQAALDARKTLRLLKFLKQGQDHPINPFIPETYYLKGFLFQVSSAI